MLIQQLLEHFDKVTTLHVDVNDVRDHLIAIGVQDEIEFRFVKMDATKIRGLLHRYTRSSGVYGEPVLCSDIIIPVDMGDEQEAWQRLVAVKELIHIIDCDSLTAQSEAAIDNLFEQFSLPPELRAPHDDTPIKKSFLNDRVRIYFALAVLIPLACRQALRPLYRDGRLSVREIAEIARVPARYIGGVMDEDFETLIQTFIEWEEIEQD